ncbi:TPA: hypothetical protein ACOAY7_002791 [Vibrio cholerae]|nr:hypothetical protein 1992IndM4_0425 [Vibrio phage ICP1]QVV97491.1 hypothetical protein 2017DRC106_0450 [Vibrio phage ICP1]QVV97718.1 hypothetical protein 2017DRC32_0450 [Vibrio phage ICP1]QVV97945.1 hypothetical protein 2017DRC48_0450 [Vibrio phage ICP1]QVV98172.1 hypothetical protein 2017DRC55_0450 [Vibrio phage ICP1]
MFKHLIVLVILILSASVYAKCPVEEVIYTPNWRENFTRFPAAERLYVVQKIDRGDFTILVLDGLQMVILGYKEEFNNIRKGVAMSKVAGEYFGRIDVDLGLIDLSGFPVDKEVWIPITAKDLRDMCSSEAAKDSFWVHRQK